MSSVENELTGFAYGEQVDSVQQRSLGYRLMIPAQPEPWSKEVEALARRLQTTAYSDHWPPMDLFCSVLVADGRRLVAVARYGLADHTPSKRRGGLELVGVLGPARLDVPTALAIYHGLKRKRASVDDLHAFAGRFSIQDFSNGAQSTEARNDPMPVLPVRLWQDGAFLFAASAPSDPDHHLQLLEQNAGNAWQWLPLVGPDFPLATYTPRGPLIAWTPHLAGVALKIDRKAAETVAHGAQRSPLWPRLALVGMIIILFALLAGNLWSIYLLHQRLQGAPSLTPQSAGVGEVVTRPAPVTIPAAARASDSRERFAEALASLLRDRGARREGELGKMRLVARYDRLVRERPDLRLSDEDVDGKVAVALVSVLAERNADHIEEVMQKALAKKGFDDRLVKLACEFVRDQFALEPAD